MKNLLKTTDPAVTTGRLNVQDYVQARKDEIKRLENAIAYASGKKRTFQTLPRTLRRRTASHNPKRVPRRLRDRAVREYLDDAPKPPPKRRRIEHNETLKVVDYTTTNKLADKPVGAKYKNRQKNQVWLPTHIWHRKRAKMTQKWEYVVPTSPTQKQYRMSHRLMNQSKNGSLLWDTSYYSTCLVSCTEVKDLDRRFPGLSKPVYQKKSWQGVAVVSGESGVTDLGPALVFRNKDSFVVNVHPSIYPQLFSDLCTIAGAQVQDLRYAIGSIDLIGTRAMSSLLSCFIPARQGAEFAKIGAVENLDLLPYHGVLAWDALDPRLNFPPSKKQQQGSMDNITKALESFNSTTESELFGSGRAASYTGMSSQKEIEARKEPGKHIKPTDSDPSIPIVLLKLEDARVRVLLPWHWVLPFWLSLVSVPNTYIAGISQFEQLAFEQSLHQFPKDYPFTPSGRQALEQVFETATAEQLKKPTSKRKPLTDQAGSTLMPEWKRISGKMIPVTVHVTKRGSPTDNARIYTVPENSLEAWKSSQHNTSRLDMLPIGELIGFVTSGAYNLETGSGTGVGHATTSSGYCIVHNPGQETLMLAKLKPVSTLYL